MYKHLITLFLFCLGFGCLFLESETLGSDDKKSNVRLGAYYFDGWTGKYPSHITNKLVDSFPEREPAWGWITSTQSIVDAQIESAANAGLSFFSFCWYFNFQNNSIDEPLNNALNCYLKSKNISKLSYCLTIVNHKQFNKSNNWKVGTDEWIKQFKNKSYLNVDNKPLIIFLSVSNLIEDFGSTDSVKIALKYFRDAAIKNGFPGISIAACISKNQNDSGLAEQCGFDFLTGYNLRTSGFTTKEQKIPIDSLQNNEYRLWDYFSKSTNLKYIPVTTLNWDPRPWATAQNNYDKTQYYVGFSEKSVFRSITNLITWLSENPKKTSTEKIGLIYAWNENGEGAYLLPLKHGPNLLNGLKQAIK